MRARLYNQMRIEQTEMLLCDTASMDTVHPLQDCPLQDIPRLAAWPEQRIPPSPPPLREKLYGDLTAPRKTASFVRATGVVVKRKRSRKKKNIRDSVHKLFFDLRKKN